MNCPRSPSAGQRGARTLFPQALRTALVTQACAHTGTKRQAHTCMHPENSFVSCLGEWPCGHGLLFPSGLACRVTPWPSGCRGPPRLPQDMLGQGVGLSQRGIYTATPPWAPSFPDADTGQAHTLSHPSDPLFPVWKAEVVTMSTCTPRWPMPAPRHGAQSGQSRWR